MHKRSMNNKKRSFSGCRNSVRTKEPTTPSTSKRYNTTNTNSGESGDFHQVQMNTVTVTVTYRWLPEAYLAGPLTLTSHATMPMSY
jgi:hypothetical protein